mgnify:CR=1 FL=1
MQSGSESATLAPPCHQAHQDEAGEQHGVGLGFRNRRRDMRLGIVRERRELVHVEFQSLGEFLVVEVEMHGQPRSQAADVEIETLV